MARRRGIVSVAKAPDRNFPNFDLIRLFAVIKASALENRVSRVITSAPRASGGNSRFNVYYPKQID